MKASDLKPKQFFHFSGDPHKQLCRNIGNAYQFLAEEEMSGNEEVTPLDVQGWDEPAHDEKLESVLAKLNGPPDAYRECVGNPRAVLARICENAKAKASRKKQPAWSIIGDWTGHGSGVSAAIYEYYRKDSDAKPVEPAPSPPPKLQLREGGYYRRRDGKVVGPAVRTNFPSHPWRIEGDNIAYNDHGQWIGENIVPTIADLVTEVPPPVSEPKPFKVMSQPKPLNWTIIDGVEVRP